MERHRMEANNLLYFLDAPSTHYRQKMGIPPPDLPLNLHVVRISPGTCILKAICSLMFLPYSF
jgi:hypothetical protein